MKGKLFLIAQAMVTTLFVGAIAAQASQPDASPATPISQRPVSGQALQLIPSAPAAMTVGTSFTYQGQLKDGANPANGQYDLAFSLYDASSAGNLISSPITLTNQTVSSGLFTVELDFGGGAFQGDARWLQTAVRPSGGGSFTQLSPRQPLTAAPYAQSLMPGATITGTIGGSTLNVVNSDSTGTGVYGSGFRGVRGDSASGYGVYGTSDFRGVVGSGTSGAGVYGSSASGVGVYGTGAGWGVYGSSNGSTGYGVYGTSSYTDTVGAYGEANTGTNAKGVYGTSTNGYGGYFTSSTGNGVYGSGFRGVYGTSSATGAGAGIYGDNTAGGNAVYGHVTGGNTGSGVVGVHDGGGNGVYGSSASGNGVFGTSGSGYGVYGTSNSTDGVHGVANSTTASGVYGVNNYFGNGGPGVYGSSFAGSGVYGTSLNTGVYGVSTSTGYGVHGDAANGFGVYGTGAYGVYGDSAQYAGWFHGNVHVTGTCCGAAEGYSQLDDPLDPANKILNQSFVQSPDMLDVYRGHVTLDASGEAWVQMPAYFEALNRNFDYQLTPVGAPAPDLYVAQEIQDNRFKIAGGNAGLKVSWQVTGMRNDAYVRAHPIQPEQDKSADQKGLYLHPKEYGQPESKGIDYQQRQKMEQQTARPPAEPTPEPLDGR